MKAIDDRIKDLAYKLNSSEIIITAIYNLAKDGEHFKQLFLNPDKIERLKIKSSVIALILAGIESNKFTKDTEFYWNEKSFTLETFK